jgi:uncharacterized membrane protein
MTVPPATILLRLIAFTVPAVLLLAGVQPLVAAAVGQVDAAWAIPLSAPAIAGAVVLIVGARVLDRGDGVAPPWYSAWVLLPGAFVLTGAAAMCLIGALVEFAGITSAMWVLLGLGLVLWSGGMLVVRQASR